jgi:endothelin-converting enzyme/putative endopeptidase
MPTLMRMSAVLLLFGSFIAPGGAQAQSPDAGKAEVKGLDPALMDKAADPCVDFYQYSCGNWLKQNPIPADQAAYGRGTELAENNRRVLKDILENASVDRPGRSATDQKIGDFYAACMDEDAIEKRGLAALKPELDRISALKSKSALADEVAHLQMINAGVLFGYESDQDFKDASSVIAEVDQGGLGLPERDFYTRTDPKSVETRKAYVQHVTNMFKLLGDSDAAAAANAQTVMTIETALANASRNVVERRDPASVYHKLKLTELEALTPAFDWKRFFAATHTPPVESLNVTEPNFFSAMSMLLQAQDLKAIQTYLRWQLVNASAVMLPRAFVNENFAFYGKNLRGQKELAPRWKRCARYTDQNLGEALGRAYVERTFGAEGKARTLQMVKDIEAAMETDLAQITWMSDATKQRAREKLQALANKIGYPDKWRDYSSYEVKRGDALGNYLRGAEFESLRQIAKIGKPVDHGEWGMTPPTVDAYYSAQMNDINFPAGILQPPFFDRAMDDAVNYGDAGAIVGHELTHGFDDQGRQFDAKGNLSDWWTPADNKEFEQRAACIVHEYDGFVAVEDVHLNGKLTLGENVADLGGAKLAFMALMQRLSNGSEKSSLIDGFTPEQRFFISHGQGWCRNSSDEVLRLNAQTDPHSTPKFRVNGVLRNMPEFQKAFACKTGTPMAPEKRCEVW